MNENDKKLFILGCQFVTFVDLSTSKDLLAQCKHVQVEMREDWNVKQHHNPQEIKVRECKVETIWEFNAPLLGHFHV